MIFKGIITALITPFDNGKIDFAALHKLLDKQIEAKINAVVIAGSTGEGSSLSESEYYELITESVRYADKRISVISGMNAVSTLEATAKVKALCELGVDSIMCTAPHYVRPEQSGLILHYKAINEASTVPLMVYIHPVRTACDFSDSTLLEIGKLNNIASIKDATSDLDKPLRLLPHMGNITMMTGNDPSVLSYKANSGSGCVSVVSNLFPKLYKKIDNLWNKGDLIEARTLLQKFYPFFSMMYSESNPIGVKYAAAKMGLCGLEIRLPLTLPSASNRAEIDESMKELLTMENNV
ncbi:MAG: 4-hydroxy-tetrahydrodipicolinate synthase [Rickettsiaceae bacterium]|nr:4-hydroxy-tetrahydrodipicolinate synthase [Rickettsiaceae bacterium]